MNLKVISPVFRSDRGVESPTRKPETRRAFGLRRRNQERGAGLQAGVGELKNSHAIVKYITLPRGISHEKRRSGLEIALLTP
jgi:hypothetical protein